MTMPATPSPLTVVVVDDDVVIARVLARAVAAEGHEAIALTDATQALRVVGERKVDIVLCDRQMPGMTGSELLTMLAGQHPGITRALMSFFVSGDELTQVINASRAQYLLQKPFRLTEVRELLSYAVAERGGAYGQRATPAHAGSTSLMRVDPGA